MSINPKKLLRRDGLFMRCFTTALALAWVSILVSDYAPPHVTPFRHGLHWLEAVGVSVLAVATWIGPRPHVPVNESEAREAIE